MIGRLGAIQRKLIDLSAHKTIGLHGPFEPIVRRPSTSEGQVVKISNCIHRGLTKKMATQLDHQDEGEKKMQSVSCTLVSAFVLFMNFAMRFTPF